MLAEPSQESLTTLLSALSERQRRVLSLRYGLQGGAPLSLRQAGKRLGITGERVRVIEAGTIARLRYQDELTRWATQPLVDALTEAGGVARFEEVMEALRRRALPHHQPSEGLVRFLHRLDQRVVRVRVGRGEVWALRACPVGAVQAIEALCISTLRESRAGLSLDRLTNMLVERLPSPRLDGAFVAGVVRVCPGVVVTKDGWCFCGRARHKLVQLMQVLRQAGTPLHVRDIKERLNQRLEEPSTAQAVHEFLRKETQVFVRVAPGTFALREWGSEAHRPSP
ncbi:MAG: sigma factor-like helix-turn-helix DNA-binding protein [Chloroflexota bacterium]|nr:sigma factor-like helix-turn-helix DNA-binding protein [Chloroflexota bacterium]